MSDPIGLTAARWYAAKMGWRVFPLMPRAKKPLIEEWQHQATSNLDTLSDWWAQWPDANVGIATGRGSGIWVLDIDGELGDESMYALREEFGELPETVISMTKRGQHHLFRYPDDCDIRNSTSKLAQNIDTRGEGGYIVAPPSIHPDGPAYEWEASSEPRKVPIAEAPAWLIERVKKPSNGAGGGQVHSEATYGPFTETAKVYAALSRLSAENYDDWLEAGMALHSTGWARAFDIWTDWSATAPGKFDIKACHEKWASFHRDGGVSLGSLFHRAAQQTSQPQEPAADALLVRRLQDIEAKPIDWLWPGRIARGKVTIMAGNPGLGKSQISASIAAIVSTGGQWPVTRETCRPGRILFLSAEDDPADTLRPRLEASGADLSRIYILDAVNDLDMDGRPLRRPFNLRTDSDLLAALIAKMADVALLVIDPITAYLGRTDSHNNAEIRGMLLPLSAIASAYNVAVLGITHLNKAGANKQDMLSRVIGSIAFVAASRSALAVMKDPKDERRRLMLPIKNNLGPDAAGFAFELRTHGLPSGIETSRVEWHPDLVNMTADEAAEGDMNSDTGRPPSNQVIVLDALAAMFAERRRNLIDSNKDPNSARVTLFELKKETGLARNRFYEARRGLIEKGKIQVEDGFVFLRGGTEDK